MNVNRIARSSAERRDQARHRVRIASALTGVSALGATGVMVLATATPAVTTSASPSTATTSHSPTSPRTTHAATPAVTSATQAPVATSGGS